MSILVTRPSPAGEELVSRLRTLGQVAWHFPLIEFSPGQQLPQLADQLAALGESDLLFALSQHAVAFAQRCQFNTLLIDRKERCATYKCSTVYSL